LRLFRAPGSATDAKRLTLASMGILLLYLGWSALDTAFPDSIDITPDILVPVAARVESDSSPDRIAEPARWIVRPFLGIVSSPDPGAAMAHAALAAFWAAAVWMFFGGAIARVAVVDLVRRERVGLRASLRFAAGKVVPLMGTPLIPLFGIAVIA